MSASVLALERAIRLGSLGAVIWMMVYRSGCPDEEGFGLLGPGLVVGVRIKVVVGIDVGFDVVEMVEHGGV
jgi:hypothetical protein